MTATPDTVTVPAGEYRELRRLALIGQAAETAAPTPGHQVVAVGAVLAGELERNLGIQLGGTGPVLIRCAVSGVRHEPGNEWAKDDLTFMGGLNWAANQTLFIVAADGLSAERIHTLWSFINDGIERQQAGH